MPENRNFEPTDQDLMVRLQGGDLDALGVLYERHRQPVYRTIRGITRDQLAAEDIIQDCFLRLNRYAHRYDVTRPFKPWLYRMAINLAHTWLASMKKCESSPDGALDWIPGPEEFCPEWQAERSDLEHRVMQAVNTLNAHQNSAVVLYYLKSQSLKEIASLLGCPVGTIKSRLYYGRENLQRHMTLAHPETKEVQYAYS